MTETERTFGTISHEGATSDVIERKAARALRDFRRDDEMERRLELRANDPDAFATLPHQERLAVNYYGLARKAAHEAALAAEGDEAA